MIPRLTRWTASLLVSVVVVTTEAGPVAPEVRALPAQVKMAGDPPPQRPELKSLHLESRSRRRVKLAAPDLQPVLAEDAAAFKKGGAKIAQRVGVRRSLNERLTPSPGGWHGLPDGTRVWATELESEGALGMRIHFEGIENFKEAELVTFASDDPTQVQGLFDDAYLDGRDSFWSPTIFAQRTTVECRVPAGAPLPSFRISEVTHQYRLPSAPTTPQVKVADSCNLDSTCYPAWASTGNAVTGLGSVGESGQLFCTGCLINDVNPAPDTDYVLTADHCISGQASASTLEFYWFYQSESCNGAVPNPATVPRTTGGADRLASSSFFSGNDFCFLRLRRGVPQGVTYAGWSVEAPGFGDIITGIHHPAGDFKRISFGRVVDSDANYWEIRWSQGVTEPGSSGSPIFNSRAEIIGQLYGGLSFCDNPQGTDFYGRFDQTLPRIRRWLLNEAPTLSNDDFANAQALEGPSGTVTGSTLDATAEVGEPSHANVGGVASIWYRWTAARDGTAVFNTQGSDFDTVLAIYTGDSLTTLQVVAANDDALDLSSRVTFSAVAGQTYYVAVDGFLGERGSVRLNWAGPGSSVPVVLSNDNFVNAARIPPAGGRESGGNRRFTRQVGEPVHAGNPGQRSAWWIWSPTESGPATVETVGSTFDTLLAVYRGTNLNAVTAVAFNDDIGRTNRQSRVQFPAVAGETYRIAVDGFYNRTTRSQSEGDIRLTVRIGDAGPSNSPPVIDLVPSLGESTPTVVRRTFAPDSCDVLRGCAEVGLRRLLTFGTEVRNSGTTNVVLPPSVLTAASDTCVGEPVWTEFARYRLLTGTNVVREQTVSACLRDDVRRDSSRTNGPVFTCDMQGLSVGWARVVPPLDPCQWLDVTDLPDGTYTLEILVDPARRLPDANRTNNLITRQVTLAPVPGPDNDDFANAAILSGPSGVAPGDNRDSTREDSEPELGVGRSVWYRWTAPCTGLATFSTQGPLDTWLAAYTNTTLATLATVARNDDAEGGVTSVIQFQAIQGITYFIAADSATATSGLFSVNWRLNNFTCVPVRPPRLVVSGTTARVESDSVLGQTYRLEASTNLVNWSVLASRAATGTTISFNEGIAPASRVRFYRIAVEARP
jgi:hypothetical protein